MVARDTQTDLAVDFEPAGWGEEAETRWPERVGGWESDAAMVEAMGVGSRGGRTGEGKVPVVEVGVGDGGCGEVWAGVLVDVGGLFEEAARGWRCHFCSLSLSLKT